MSYIGRILIANVDKRLLLLPATDLLRKEGYECNFSHDVETVIEMLKYVEFDLLITYININGNNELIILKELAEHVKELPIILVTRSSLSDVQSCSLKPSAITCLSMPLDIDELLIQVKCSINGNPLS